MADEIKIDFSRATIGALVNFMANPNDIGKIINWLDLVVIGGVRNRPVTDLAKIVSAYHVAAEEQTELIAMAVALIVNYLKGDK